MRAAIYVIVPTEPSNYLGHSRLIESSPKNYEGYVSSRVSRNIGVIGFLD